MLKFVRGRLPMYVLHLHIQSISGSMATGFIMAVIMYGAKVIGLLPVTAIPGSRAIGKTPVAEINGYRGIGDNLMQIDN